MLFYLFTRYKLISSLKFEKVEKSYWNEERSFKILKYTSTELGSEAGK